MAYAYYLSFRPHEQELAAAEAAALVPGIALSGPLARAPVAVNVRRAAHVALCARVLAEGASFSQVLAQLEALSPKAHDFAIEVRKVPPKPDLHSVQAAVLLADRMSGAPRLSHPAEQYVLLARKDWFIFGRILSRYDRGWTVHEHKPHTFSNALPARLARAMVNLVARPGDRVVDPCCGVGTILLEAAGMGMVAVGFDLNKKMTSPALANLRHFGLRGLVCAGDARDAAGSFDAVVVDPPYGHTSRRASDLYPELLANAVRLAPRISIVTAEPLEDLLTEAGYQLTARARWTKGQLVRHVYAGRLAGEEG